MYVGQGTPTPERYAEIQKALAAKGYFDGDPNGIWDSKSIESLKRFEQDQNITPDGKLDSLSLIALGLGPSRGVPGQQQHTEPIGPAPPPTEPQPETPPGPQPPL